MTPQNEPRLSKTERTAQAREQARRIREAHAKKEKRNGWLIRGGVLLAAVVVVVIVALLIVQGTKKPEAIADSGPVPANANTYGGVVQDQNGVVKNASPGEVNKATLPAAPTSAAASAAATDLASIGIAPSADGKPVQIVAYIDYICPACNQFETKFGPQLKQWQDSGKATIEYRAAGILDQFSTTNYSSRSAAAAACLVDTSPDKFADYFTQLFAQQPAENSAGLSNDQLKKIARDVGAADIGSCVDNKTYRPFVQYSTATAHAHGVNGTPTVFVDGKQYTDTTVAFDAFAQPIIDAKK
ncbi:thioredoxin domain-containing protein [Paenarthrobacter sp. PH39-S1]|uniref:DsbA family protein n=1 Tax=Paenarthrobacter sp. PH39-S1 TaxID=3046204 RepID=UPI0024BAA808|nr:thioredoxin domain-containing protein [Paenarthrobacter sp. PH39-S1]MDJ0358170.1 thioredoxin domain-containing protein [Paenarthrobacter sp. PH39-S1]